MSKFSCYALTQAEREALAGLGVDDESSLSLQQLWALMDLVWDLYGCDQRRLDPNAYSKFYAHPIWLLNGIFIERDQVSMGHRRAIAAFVADLKPNSIVDFGGGFGTLARLLAEEVPFATVDICEPYPSRQGLEAVNDYASLQFVSSMLPNAYDVLVSTDVLEHVFAPLQLLDKFSNAVKPGGYLLIANCFYPVIKCHLPCTFHLRYTFDCFAWLFGLRPLGPCHGSHARIYQRSGMRKLPWFVIRFLEVVSRFLFPLLLAIRNVYKFILSASRRSVGAV